MHMLVGCTAEVGGQVGPGQQGRVGLPGRGGQTGAHLVDVVGGRLVELPADHLDLVHLVRGEEGGRGAPVADDAGAAAGAAGAAKVEAAAGHRGGGRAEVVRFRGRVRQRGRRVDRAGRRDDGDGAGRVDGRGDASDADRRVVPVATSDCPSAESVSSPSFNAAPLSVREWVLPLSAVRRLTAKPLGVPAVL
jgi:hypothetical protein